MSHDHSSSSSSRPLLLAIGALLLCYLAGGALGWPQTATRQVVEAHEAHEEHEHEHDEQHTTTAGAKDEESPAQAHPAPPPYFTVIPFALLLAAIAVLPLIPATEHWWEDNLHRFYVAAGLGVATLLYYAFAYGAIASSIQGHWPAHHTVEATGSGAQWGFAWTVLANAILHEFIPFIVLLFSLYTISGGIRIEGDLRAHALTNTVFIAIGGLLASFIGTTGAAMLLIRPLLETNAERRHVRHTVVFFIFVVCNCGGCLLPIGDPPLFLGYLRGVDFLWTMMLWPEWLMINVALLAIYFVWDHFFCYPKETIRDIQRDETQTRPLRISGLGINGLLLAGVIVSVALLDPSKTLPGTDWHPWYYMREVVQIGLVGLSLLLGSSIVRSANKFNYHAIVEVAALFCGIFICMQPALQILNVHGGELGVDTPMKFFWVTGGLSSILDNAPTYVVFFETAKVWTAENASGGQLMAGVAVDMLRAISLGAVFMGAMTYIGNGPNFMVKAIAEKSGVKMPSFFGYMAYSCAVLLPLLILLSLLRLATG